MRNATTWTRGNGGGRKPGARNKAKREIRQLMVRLERADSLHPDRWLNRLETIALTADPGPAVAAVRALLEFRYGRPSAEIDLNVEHSSASIVELLEQIGRSDAHRQRLEEREQRQLAAIETQTVKEQAS